MFPLLQKAMLGGLAVALLACVAIPVAAGGYDDEGILYRPYLQATPQPSPVSPSAFTPPPPDFGPCCPFFPHDFRVSGAKWYLFSPTFKAFPVWSGYNDTYPRGTGTEFFFSRPESGF